MKKRIDWFNIHQACDLISKRIKARDDINITSIVAIARGGLIPASLLASILKVTNFTTYGISSYEGKEQGKFKEYQPLPFQYPTPEEDDILIVDDLSHTGLTFEYTRQQIDKNLVYNKARQKTHNIYTAAPYIKTHTKVIPDFWVTEVPEEQWLIFPWEI
jgi:hypoxanthine phosphoribosyltransferase